ncbi:PTS sugar transporter subunit IIA [Clostridium tyrobutyricum]|uniref:PTS system, mannose-specific IIA component n=1 Tax=Clostridium tyrobutyricum DIVETGP TaxID=1408889 RepID=W6N5N1_CLOTY|nr:hypothetical protein [Clostridium tyrobutyricum]AND83581.1 PTS system mannose/fructose subfamily IIA component [Clostridium tyrobutyricum]ANP68362.1 PTS fructose transporter subunit IIA [Clostridium tyrobutyricum]MBV4425797.1 PTS fructose transporter subunit IIA [Clostridium tyrobutyricum]MBV4428004.1 PTS fructose transporter subunit IIA [Clostridium tyrobutyricum]MBV4438534.1 PTS fructose transporter subunit IIA [Clostridium tyrobutyricum]
MRKILIATHGTLARGAKNTIELLVGKIADITCISAYVDKEGEDITKSIEKFFKSIKSEDEVVVFTDIIGGSVNQKIVSYASQSNALVVSGFNLPVILTVILENGVISKERLNEIIAESREQLKLVEIDVNENNNDEDFLE